MKTHNKTVASIKTLILALILAAGVSYISAWTGPHSTAPTCITDPTSANYDSGCSAPLNVALSTQSKLGALFLNTSSNPLPIGLEVFGQSIFNGAVQINSGSPAAGKVLTATDASGTASWATISTSGSIPNTMSVISSTQSWTVPTGVTKIRVRVWGAGGGGGGSTGAAGVGGGGGAGGYAESVLSVTPGTSYTVTVGAGGTAGTGSTAGTNGGNSSFGNLVTANGGTAGTYDGGGNGISAAGGTAAGTIALAGGAGMIGGSNSPVANGGNAPEGGAGGVGGPNTDPGGNGRAGITPGGGGGGSGNSNTGSKMGGAGAAGRVVIEY